MSETVIAGGSILMFALAVLAIILAILWIFLPFIIMSKLGAIERVLQALHEIEKAKYQERQSHKNPKVSDVPGLPPGISRY